MSAADEAIKLCLDAKGHLEALASIVKGLEDLGERDHDLRYLAGLVEAQPQFVLRAARVGEEVEELKAAAAGRTSPRSLRLQAEADVIAREQRKRLRRETEHSEKNGWKVAVPPAAKR